MELSEILTHLGEERENYFNAVAPPIMQTSNFCFNNVQQMREGLTKEFETPFYTRGYNPGVATLRKKIAALEGSEDALVFGSGSAVIAAAVLSCVQGGDHVVCVQKPYSWTHKLLLNMLSRYGVTTTMVDGTDVNNFEAAIRDNTALIYLESPNSLTFELQDLKAVATMARAKGIATICDNSYATPLHQQPIALGVDIVVHSASKYLNGHGDVVAGVLCSTKKRVDAIFASELMTLGGIISPNDAWLMMRGLRTLDIRVKRSTESAEKVVAFLTQHPGVSQINYPFSPQHPQYELAQQQMKAGSGLFSMLLNTNEIKKAEAFCNALECFLLACSWGGYESLLFPVCALYDSQNYDNPDLPWNLVRIYIGLEDPDLLIADLEQALKQL